MRRAKSGSEGHTTIYDLIKRRELVKVNIGRRSFVTRESLERYVARLANEAATTTPTDVPDATRSPSAAPVGDLSPPRVTA